MNRGRPDERLQQADAYFNAWNAHDTDAIIALYSDRGSYADPNVPDGISGPQVICRRREDEN